MTARLPAPSRHYAQGPCRTARTGQSRSRALSRMIDDGVVLIALRLWEWPSKQPKFKLRHPLFLKTLGVNLALPTAMAHIAPIELRPNDLASPRTPRRTDDFPPNLETNR